MSSGWNCDPSSNSTEIEGDPDVAGIGVIIGFVGTAWLVVLILVVYSIAFYDPTTNPFSEDLDEKLARPNPVDMIFYKTRVWVFGLVGAAEGQCEMIKSLRAKIRSPGSREVFIEVVMALSDAQIVTGLAILTSGYYSATRGMSGYHWRTMVQVAWFSTITHLAALSCLRTHLHRNQLKRTMRLILMLFLAVILIFASLVTADSDFRDDLPAICFLGTITTSETRLKNFDVIVPAMLLIYNILLRAFKLHQASSEGLPSWIRRWSIWLMKPCSRAILSIATKPTLNNNVSRFMNTAIYTMVVQPVIAGLILAKTYYMIYTSMTAEIYWLLVSAFWGTLNLLQLRDKNPPGENNWTFGQVVPCALFLAPVLALIDTLAKTWNVPASSLSSPMGPAPRVLKSNRYPRPSGNNVESPALHNGDLSVATSPLAEDNLLSHVQNRESRMHSIISAQPLVTSYTGVENQPFLGYFEDMPCFVSLTMQICSWLVFMTFWTFFADFESFSFVHEWVDNQSVLGEDFNNSPGGFEEEDPPFRVYQNISPAANFYYELPYILLVAPTYSVIYLILYPRRRRSFASSLTLWNIAVRFFTDLVLPAALILLAMWSYILVYFDPSLILWASIIGLFWLFSIARILLGLYVDNVLAWLLGSLLG